MEKTEDVSYIGTRICVHFIDPESVSYCLLGVVFVPRLSLQADVNIYPYGVIL